MNGQLSMYEFACHNYIAQQKPCSRQMYVQINETDIIFIESLLSSKV